VNVFTSAFKTSKYQQYFVCVCITLKQINIKLTHKNHVLFQIVNFL